MQPERGDFATEVNLLCPEIGVPVTTPVHKASTLSGLRASIPVGVSFLNTRIIYYILNLNHQMRIFF